MAGNQRTGHGWSHQSAEQLLHIKTQRSEGHGVRAMPVVGQNGSNTLARMAHMLPIRRQSRQHSSLSYFPTRIQDALTSCTSKASVHHCLGKLQQGETLYKMNRRRLPGHCKPKICRVDRNLLYFRYSSAATCCGVRIPSNKETKVDLRHIRTVRFGRFDNKDDSPRKFRKMNSISIVFDSSSRLPLNFLAKDEETAEMWVQGLNYLRKQILALKPRLQHELIIWEKFGSVDHDKDGHVSFSDVHRTICKNATVPRSPSEIKTAFEKHSMETGKCDFTRFFDFYKSVSCRKEIVDIFNEISADQSYITVRELYKFVQKTQCDGQITEKDCAKIIDDYESDDRAREKFLLTLPGFDLYLSSRFSEIFNWRHDEVYQDMKQPLSHYFIASSHNTYLTGDQLTESSSTDAYMNALLKGCRCVELDCWDGSDGDPIIYHGYTFTSRIKFKDVIEVIGKYAFETSVYPLILSIENHCSVPQQDKMALYLKQILGSELLTTTIHPDDQEVQLPSPSALRGKILLKGKKLPPQLANNVTEAGDVSNDDEAEETKFDFQEDDLGSGKSRLENNRINPEPRRILRLKNENFFVRRFRANSNRSSAGYSTPSTNNSSRKSSEKVKHNLSKSFSDLVVYCKSVKFKSFQIGTNESRKFNEISSFSEAKALKLAKSNLGDSIEYHKHRLSRTYPAGFRTDSSNYDPQPMWNAGFQIVALNYQTKSDEMETCVGKFRQNGNCGYVIKPRDQRLPQSSVEEEDLSSAKLLHVHLISGQNLGSETSNLFSEITVSGDLQDVAHRLTATTATKGCSITWDEKFIFFINKPELAMLKFVVRDRDKAPEKIGQHTLPFTSVAQGYRHVPLLKRDGTRLPDASLFVNVRVEEATKRHHDQGRLKSSRDASSNDVKTSESSNDVIFFEEYQCTRC